MKRTSLVLAATVMAIFAMTTISCTKENEVDLSGYLTKEELRNAGYMTQEEFEQWEREHTTGPTSTQLVTVKDFNVSFPAANDAYEVTATYTGLQGTLKQDDVLLVYFNASAYGAPGWMQLPFEFGNISMLYFRQSNGNLTFRKGRAMHVQFTEAAETFQAKALIIPSTIYMANCKKGVDHNSYNDVVKAYKLCE